MMKSKIFSGVLSTNPTVEERLLQLAELRGAVMLIRDILRDMEEQKPLIDISYERNMLIANMAVSNMLFLIENKKKKAFEKYRSSNTLDYDKTKEKE